MNEKACPRSVILSWVIAAASSDRQFEWPRSDCSLYNHR